MGGDAAPASFPDSEPVRAPELAAEPAAVADAETLAEAVEAAEAVVEAVAEAEAEEDEAAEGGAGEAVPDSDDASEPAESQRGSKRESKRWELVIAIAVAVAAMTGAVLTYLSIQREAAAADNDGQSVAQAILIQTQQVTAEANTDATAGSVARARQLLAEANAVFATDPAQASLIRQDAASLAPALGPAEGYLIGSGVTAQFNYAAALQGSLAVETSVSMPPDEPDRTAQLAERQRVTAEHIAMSVVGLLCVVLLLTIARLAKKKWLKLGVLAAASFGYAAALSVGLIAQFS
jgi:hypothetical protein